MSTATAIQNALANFQTLPLKDAARQLLAALGYRSEKFIPGAGSSPQDFLDLFDVDHKLDHAKALFSDWKSADLLFQLTDQELSRESSLFTDDSVQRGLLKSYIFIAIELKGGDYARGKFSAIARQINRLFPMPVMVIFKYGADIPASAPGKKAVRNVCPTLTIAVINRRRNKHDDTKDVLEKATLIRDINFAQPHRGHLDILASLALPNLVHPQKQPITDFDTLHAAWEQIFNIELLNEHFYRELANWYFWALPQVEFPADLEPDDEKRRATGLIRLLTRLIFCWFLKEKGLIPEKLFHPTDLARLLKGFDPESTTSSTYYHAILQNLFFATLNQRMGKDAKGKPYRVFARDEGFAKNRATYDVNNLYRYEDLFAVPEDEALALFADIPFLNGGLFECLDQSSSDNPVGASPKKRYLDGFSRNPEKRPHIPDHLFFDSGETTDLSIVYDDKKRKAERVTGLITILNRYKFTIVENTPIDQEIALDPELLGKVFENLLASYNEETKTTARKQTGSFYTPRPIVDYMVDESLKAHLERKLAEQSSSDNPVACNINQQSNSDNPVACNIYQQSSSDNPVADPPPPTETGLSLLPYNPNAPVEKRRANLPHWTQEGTTYWVTFRLADSLPQEKLKDWKAERDLWASHHPEPWSDSDWKEYHERFGDRLESWLDAGEGECHLRRPEIRAIVEKCLRQFNGTRYDLGPWVIMPNHVHLLIRPNGKQSLSKILQGIKGVSAKECNALLGRTGQPFWQEESFDHIVRSQAQYERFVRYIEENPVKAKLREGEFSIAKVAQTQCSRGNLAAVTGTECSRGNLAPVSNQTGTGLSQLRSKLDHLFSYTDEPHQFSEPEVATLISAIDEIKILDPACGSGAFPMGVLHKLVYILGKLDPHNERWKQTQLAKLDSAPMREKLERAFADNNYDYGRKLYLIENCLYGVDIQPIAIQITKLRFFISLICEQGSSDNPVAVNSSSTETRLSRQHSENLGIRPLPNLETKFVAANTLISLPIPEPDLFLRSLIEPIEKEIEAAYHSHFTIQRRDQKLALQKKIKTLRQKLTDTLLNGLGANEGSDVAKKAKLLADWDPFDPQATADFFDPHWMFGRSLKDGFDIVIGNPPYLRIQGIQQTNPKAAEYYKQHYTAATGSFDLYVIFMERGMQLIGKTGILSYINPDKWVNASFGKGIRRFAIDQRNVHKLISFGAHQVFSACTYSSLLWMGRSPTAGLEYARVAPEESKAVTLEDELAKLEPSVFARIPLDSLSDEPWILAAGNSGGAISAIQAHHRTAGHVFAKMFQGIASSKDSVYFLKDAEDQGSTWEATSPELGERIRIEKGLVRPLLMGDQVHRYEPIRSNKVVLFPYWLMGGDNESAEVMKPNEIEARFPLGWQYLLRCSDVLKGRERGRLLGDPLWYRYIYPKNQTLFGRPKLLAPDISLGGNFTLDINGEYYTTTTVYGYIKHAKVWESYEFLLAVMNSKVLWFYLKTSGSVLANGYFRYKPAYLQNFPIPEVSKKAEATISTLVKCMLAAKADGTSSAPAFLEDLIDACVMECYFREHMTERDLLFHDSVAATILSLPSDNPQTGLSALLSLNAPSHPIRQRLDRICTASPDLLAIIKQEGAVK